MHHVYAYMPIPYAMCAYTMVEAELQAMREAVRIAERRAVAAEALLGQALVLRCICVCVHIEKHIEVHVMCTCFSYAFPHWKTTYRSHAVTCRTYAVHDYIMAVHGGGVSRAFRHLGA